MSSRTQLPLVAALIIVIPISSNLLLLQGTYSKGLLFALDLLCSILISFLASIEGPSMHRIGLNRVVLGNIYSLKLDLGTV